MSAVGAVVSVQGNGDGTITVTCRPCVVCEESASHTLDQEAFYAWQNGTLIQDAFPELSAGDREELVSGTHDKCFDVLFGEEE